MRRALLPIGILIEIPLLLVGAVLAIIAPVRVAMAWAVFWSENLPDRCWYLGGPWREKRGQP